jgi:transposase-like protein
VIGALERGGEVVTSVVPNLALPTLQGFIRQNVMPGGDVHTDERRSYIGLHKHGYRHMTCNHGVMEYVSPLGATVNQIESFWRHLKCSIKGTHIHVSPKYLGRYAKEFEFRFNRRHNPAAMFPALISTFPTLN